MADTVGLVAAIIQIGGLALRVIKRIDDLKAQLNDVPQLLVPIVVEMDFNRELLGQLDQTAIHEAGLDDPVEALLKSFSGLLNELDDTLKRMRIDKTRSFYTYVRPASYSIRNDDKIQRLIENLRSHATNLRHIISQFRQDPGSMSRASRRYQTGAVRFPVAQFVGREDTIAAIKAHFRDFTQKRVRVVVQGLGGQGKTQLSLEVARQLYDESYMHSVLWVDATSKSSMSKSFESICDSIHHEQSLPAEPGPRLQAAKDIMETWSDPWLLVFDNYDDPTQLPDLLTCLPHSTNANVLITTRCLQVEHVSTLFVPLAGLDEDSAISLLLTRCNMQETLATRDQARCIVRKLAYLPLAVVQAGAYCLRHQLCLSEFLSSFDKKKETVLEYAPEVWEYTKLVDGATKLSAMTVFTTWEMSLEHFGPDSRSRASARDFLSNCAFLDHQRLSELVFRYKISKEASNLHGDCEWQQMFSNSNTTELSWSSAVFEDFIHRLSLHSLINRTKDKGSLCFSIHPLVAEWLRATCDTSKTGYRHTLLRSIHLVAATLKNEIKRCFTFSAQKFTSDEKQELMAHMMACEGHLKTSGSMALGRHPLIDEGFLFAVFYNETWLSEKAYSICKVVIDSRKRVSGENDASVWDAKAFLGKVTSTEGHFPEARVIHEAVFQYRLDNYGKRDPRTILSEMNSKIVPETWIGSIYILDRVWELIHSGVCHMYYEEFPWEVPGRRIYFQYIKCLDMFDELDSEFEIYPVRFSFHKFVADCNLWINVTNGILWRKMGYTSTTVTVLQHCVQAVKQLCGPEHRHTLDVLGAFAKSLEDTGLPTQFRAAELIHRNILETYLTNSHRNDLERLNTRVDLAWNLHLQDRNNEAMETLDIDVAAYNSPDFCTMPLYRKACRTFVAILLASQRIDKAEAWIKNCEILRGQEPKEQTFDIFEMRIAIEICISRIALDISKCPCRHGRLRELASFMQQLYTTTLHDARKDNSESPRKFRKIVLYLRVCRSYAHLQEIRGDKKDAIAALTSAVEICSGWFVDSDIWSMEAFMYLADCKKRFGQPLHGMSERMKQICERLVEMKGDLHPMVTEAKTLLCTVYEEEHQFEEASILREEIVSESSRIYGSAHQRTRQAQLEHAQVLLLKDHTKFQEVIVSLFGIYTTACDSSDLADLKLGLTCLEKREELLQQHKMKKDLRKTRHLLAVLRMRFTEAEDIQRDVRGSWCSCKQTGTERTEMAKGGDIENINRRRSMLIGSIKAGMYLFRR